jgi:hypothetical protein
LIRISTEGARKGEGKMPSKTTVDKAKADLRRGKRPSTAAGEFVHEEMDHIRHGKHGARSAKQAIAIGLSKARRAGVPLPPPQRGQASERTRRSATRAYEAGQGKRKPRAPSARRGRATLAALEREPKTAASKSALGQQARQAARRRKAATKPRSKARSATKPQRKATTPRRRTRRKTTSRSRAST